MPPATGFAHSPFECRLRFFRPPRWVGLASDRGGAAEAPARATPAPPPPALPPASAPAPPASAAEPAPAAPASADGERLEAALAHVRAAVADMARERTDRLREWQRAAVELAMTIATRVLHDRVAAGDFPIEAKVRDMIAQLGEDAPVTVRLNPADLELLRSRLGGAPLAPDRESPRFVPDPALARGECQVEGRESLLLSDVSRELQTIRDDLLRSLDHARP